MSNKNRRLESQRKEQQRQLHAEWVQTELPELSYLELLQNTIWDYNHVTKKDHQLPIGEFSDKATLDRLCVNYARHKLCHGYDASYSRKPNCLTDSEAGDTAKRVVLGLIAMKWPCLAEECRRQLKDQ